MTLPLFGGLFCQSVWAFVEPMTPTSPIPIKIRVRVGDRVPVATIQGFDLQFREGQDRNIAVDRKSSWQFQCSDGRIQANRISTGIAAPGGNRFRFQGPVVIQSQSGFITFNHGLYRHELQIYSKSNQCEVVNHLELEKYLDGVVNSEFSSKWSEEAIAAQIVAARTYAYYQILAVHRNQNSHYDVDASVKDQMYLGSFREDFHASRVVDKTRGMVLTSGRNTVPVPIKAFYHSTCGGVTELPENVWGNSFPGMRRHVICPYCSSSPRFRWSMDLDRSSLQEAIRKGLALAKRPKGSLVGLEPVESDPSGRVIRVRSLWQTAPPLVEETVISAVNLRDWIGPTKFRSTRFQVSVLGQGSERRWHFEGLGNGHGVGMCQWGAKIMAEKRNGMMAILKHYYPDAILRRLW